MPIYEYACETCGHKFEKLMKISAEAPPCDNCGSAEVKKLVSASAFVLKGGGWYKDHYGLKGKSSGGDSGGSDSKASKALDKMQSAKTAAKSGDSGSSSSSSSTTSSKGDA